MAAKHAIARLGQEKPVYGVILQVFPRLMTVKEDRELLRLAQTFGEVTSFFNMKSRWPVPAPNRYLVTYKDAEEASSLLRSVPLEFVFDSPVDEDNPLVKAISEHSLNLQAEAEEQSSTSSSSQTSQPQSRHTKLSSHPAAPLKYSLNASMSLQDHMKALRRSPYWGAFNPQTKKIEFQDLVRTVPNFGLADITSLRGPDQPSSVVKERMRRVESRKRLREVKEERTVWRAHWVDSEVKFLPEKNEQREGEDRDRGY